MIYLKIILNEFIINRAAGDPKDIANVLSLVEKIKTKDSVIILLSPELMRTYYKKAKVLERQLKKLPKAIKNFILLTQDSDKAPMANQLANIELPESLEHDREIIATAATWDSNKFLITTDEDLIRLLEEESIATAHHIEALTPEDALQRIEELD